ncbi:hypothetical protein LUZ60_011736 [Juncus effusus]|nr:hypothetical protein LUZ60_011736 [Juncus effusus]
MSTTQEKEEQSTPKLKLKLLVDEHSNRVLFAEAGKEAVDFLLGLLRLPLGLVTRLLLGEHISVSQIPGSLGSIYTSIRDLDETYLVSPDRDLLLNPRLPSVSLPLLESEPAPTVTPPPKKYYRCSGIVGHCRGNPTFMTDTAGLQCPFCRQPMVVEIRFVEKPQLESRESGYVKGIATYLIMDDLSVTPMSTISAINLLNRFQVKDLSMLCEMTIEFGIQEALELLNGSIQSTTVLTDVFLSRPRVEIDRINAT